MLTQKVTFDWIDYSIFISLLLLSLLIGLYYGFFQKQNTTSEYLFGGKTMNYIPVATSILASFLSGISFLGIPTEVYLHGSSYFASVFSALIIALISTKLTLPVLYDLGVSTVYEYLELRFSKKIKTLATLLYIISLFLYIPIVVYVPALAFSQVTGWGVHVLTPIFSIVCITYTSMGGVKAVVWTDTVQFGFTICGLTTVLILGLYSVGGIAEVWRRNEDGGRLVFFEMELDPLRRDTFWGMFIGLTTSMLGRLGLGQKFVQRFLAIEKKSDMKKAMYMVSIGWAVLQVACVCAGLLLYAQYYNCDPLKSKKIERNDQILPYYVMDVAGNINGLPGLFLAGLVSSGLSTMSASLNTLSALIYDVAINDCIPENSQKDARSAKIMKFLSVLIGVITIMMIFLVEKLGTVFELCFSLSSATEGTLLGLLLLGFFFPWVKKTGAVIGASISLVIMLWYVATTQWLTLMKRIKITSLPTSVEGCSSNNNDTSIYEITTQNPTKLADDEPSVIFRLAVTYYTLVGCLITIVIACIASYFFGEFDMKNVDSQHVSKLFRRFIPKNKNCSEGNDLGIDNIALEKSNNRGETETT